jgi:hypothetical protein
VGTVTVMMKQLNELVPITDSEEYFNKIVENLWILRQKKRYCVENNQPVPGVRG